jgi:hypothetical protein
LRRKRRTKRKEGKLRKKSRKMEEGFREKRNQGKIGNVFILRGREGMEKKLEGVGASERMYIR